MPSFVVPQLTGAEASGSRQLLRASLGSPAAFNVQVHTLSSKPGRVIQDQQGALVDKEPVFEDTPVYEVRLRYAAYMGLRLELLGKPPKMR